MGHMKQLFARRNFMKKLHIVAMATVVVMMVVGTVIAQRENQPPREDEARPRRPQRAEEGQAPGREGQGRGAQRQ